MWSPSLFLQKSKFFCFIYLWHPSDAVQHLSKVVSEVPDSNIWGKISQISSGRFHMGQSKLKNDNLLFITTWFAFFS